MQKMNIIDIRTDVLCIDSIVKQLDNQQSGTMKICHSRVVVVTGRQPAFLLALL